jgi:Na+/H+-dicarboxylate symporter
MGLPRRPNPTLLVAIALVAGFIVGIIARSTPIPGVVGPIGTMWVNAIRMPVLPLIVCLLISAIAGARDARAVGVIGVRALAVFFLLATFYALLVSPIAPWLMSYVQLDEASTASLRAAARIDPTVLRTISLTDWFLSLVPNNPIRTAADGALLPLVVFSVAYGLALSRVGEGLREGHVTFFRGVAEAMTVIIRWVLAVAPIGVFALAVSIGAHLGLSAAGAIAYYIAMMCALLIIGLGILYLITVRLAHVPMATFARALFPAQSIAISSRSSLAALPVLIDDARTHLKLPDSITSFVLPLGASIFKLNSPITWPLGAALVAQLYGVDFAGTNVLIFAIGTVILGFTVPGIPSGGFFVQAPLYAAVGLPPEGIGLLIAVDLIPDMFKTTLNVTSYASAGLLVAQTSKVV